MFWRLLLLLILILPFLPAIAIGLVALIAQVQGCRPDAAAPCLIFGTSASELIALVLRHTAEAIDLAERSPPADRQELIYHAVMAAALVACYVAVTRGWVHTASRILLGVVITLVSGSLPFLASKAVLQILTGLGCRETVKPCMLFGGDIQPGAPINIINWAEAHVASYSLAVAIFVIYAGYLIVLTLLSRSAAARVK